MTQPLYRRSDVLRGMLIYASGDAIAASILGAAQWPRFFGIMLVGGAVYALEIPHYFRWIERRTANPWGRTLLAIAYFNPLWIARHLLFIHLFSGKRIGWHLLETGTEAFVAYSPLALAANYWIQNRLTGRLRFVGSALFSTLMAVLYALSEVLF